MRGPVLYKFGDLGALVLSSLPLVLSFSYFFLQMRGVACSLEIWRLGALTFIVVLPFTYFFLQMRGPCSLDCGPWPLPLVLSFTPFLLFSVTFCCLAMPFLRVFLQNITV